MEDDLDKLIKHTLNNIAESIKAIPHRKVGAILPEVI